MRIVTQLSIFLENKPGILARVCSAFAEKGINMEGIMVEDGVDHAVVRMVVDSNKKAKDLLEDHGAVCLEKEVLALDMKDAPGQLVYVADKLAKARINIDYAYGSSAPEKGTATLYLRVSDAKQAMKILK